MVERLARHTARMEVDWTGLDWNCDVLFMEVAAVGALPEVAALPGKPETIVPGKHQKATNQSCSR